MFLLTAICGLLAVCFVLLPSIERTKFSPRSAMCVLLGYSPEHKGYRCYDPISRRFRISHHVTFLEDVPYYSSSSPDLHFLQRPDPVLSQASVPFSIMLPGVIPSPVPPPPASSASPSGSVDSESTSAPLDSSSGSHSLVSVPPSPVDDPADAAPRRPPDRFVFSTVHTYTPLFQSFLAVILSSGALVIS